MWRIHQLLKKSIILNVRRRSKRVIVRHHNKHSYSSINDMWEAEMNPKAKNRSFIVDPIGSLTNWYTKANKFWNSSDATYDGVMSGYGKLSQIDISCSKQFLQSYIEKNPTFERKRVLDCGAGIGRIAKQFLCGFFSTVDLIDQCEKYIDKAKQFLRGYNIGKFYAMGLQQFNFQHKYNCIWIQWVLSHLTDQDAVNFLKRAKSALQKEGIIVVKENHCFEGFLVDKEDYSVSRCADLYKKIFSEAGLEIVEQKEQNDWPAELLDVKMYILK